MGSASEKGTGYLSLSIINLFKNLFHESKAQCHSPLHLPVSGGSQLAAGWVLVTGQVLVAKRVIAILKLPRTVSPPLSVTSIMTSTKKPHVPWSHWDKFLFIVLGIVAALAVGIVLWFRGLDINPSITVPTPTMPVPNARDYFEAAGNAKIEDKWVSGDASKDNSPAGMAAKEKTLQRNARAFQLLHQGFAYPYHASPVRSFYANDFPFYAKDRSLARVLGLQASVAAQKGDWNGSMQAAMDGVQMGEELPHGGSLIAMLVGAACEAIGRRQAWDAVDHLSTAEARKAARRLEHIRAYHVSFAEMMQEDKWSGQASLLETMRQPDWPGTGWNTDTGAKASLKNTVTATRIRLTGKRTIMTNFTNYMDQSIANARQPYAAHLPAPPIPSDPLNQMMLSEGLNMARLSEAVTDTQSALLLTMLALHAYKLEHSIYPTSLSALVPQYLKAVPTDPFALSGPISYKVLGAKFLLYSVGPDGKDDGGTAVFDKMVPAPLLKATYDRRYLVTAESRGDIVAGVNVN